MGLRDAQQLAGRCPMERQGAGLTLPAGLQLGKVLVLESLLRGAPPRRVEAEHAGQQVDGDLARRAQPPEQRRRPALQPLHRTSNCVLACFCDRSCSAVARSRFTSFGRVGSFRCVAWLRTAYQQDCVTMRCDASLYKALPPVPGWGCST